MTTHAANFARRIIEKVSDCLVCVIFGLLGGCSEETEMSDIAVTIIARVLMVLGAIFIAFVLWAAFYRWPF
jgi:hypothetical protein